MRSDLDQAQELEMVLIIIPGEIKLIRLNKSFTVSCA